MNTNNDSQPKPVPGMRRLARRREERLAREARSVADAAARAAWRIEVAEHRKAKAAGTLPPAKAPGEIPDIGGDPM
jgi:hypothetical protein